MPQITTTRLREERLQRTIFTAARRSAAHAPSIHIARQTLAHTAHSLAAKQDILNILNS